MEAALAKKQLLGEAWEITKRHFGIIFGLLFLFLLFYFAFFTALGLFQKIFPILSIIPQIAGLLLLLMIYAGIYRMGLNLIRGQPAPISLLFSQYHKVWRVIAGSFLYMVIVGFGTLLLIVPGIIWGLQFSQFFLLIVDENCGPIEALKRSSKLTCGAKWDLFWMSWILVGISFLGMIALFIGLLVAIPFIWIVYLKMYEALRLRAEPKAVFETV